MLRFLVDRFRREAGCQAGSLRRIDVPTYHPEFYRGMWQVWYYEPTGPDVDDTDDPSKYLEANKSKMATAEGASTSAS